MPDLSFQVQGAEPERDAAVPALRFALEVREQGDPPTPIHSVALRCQIRIEPARRSYSGAERQRLLDLFGTPDRWGQTLRPMLWTHTIATVPPFTRQMSVGLVVPCNFDFSLAATRYFSALEDGDLPLCFLFSGTIFFQGDEDRLQIAQIPWEKEAVYRLPARTWQEVRKHYYPNTSWLGLSSDLFDRLEEYRRARGLPTAEQALEKLLGAVAGANKP